jgi:hypothetical protein
MSQNGGEGARKGRIEGKMEGETLIFKLERDPSLLLD